MEATMPVEPKVKDPDLVEEIEYTKGDDCEVAKPEETAKEATE